MTIHTDWSKCLPDNTALQIKTSLPGVSSLSLPPGEARCIRPLLLTTFGYVPCLPSFPCSQKVPSDAATPSPPPSPPTPPPQVTQGAQKTQEASGRGLGEGGRELLLKSPANESTTPFPHLLWSLRLGRSSQEQQEGPEAPEPQPPPQSFVKSSSLLFLTHTGPLGRCSHVSEGPILVRLDSGRISVEGSTIGKDHSLLHWFNLLLARLIAGC